MKYLLDTCTVSDFIKGQLGVLSRVKATAPSLVAISSITRMEIEFGLILNPERAGGGGLAVIRFGRRATVSQFIRNTLPRADGG